MEIKQLRWDVFLKHKTQNMPQLHETMYGKKLLEHDIPEIHRQLKRIADSLELLAQPLAEKKKKLEIKKIKSGGTYEHLESLRQGRNKH
jgi:hypothetical protein